MKAWQRGYYQIHFFGGCRFPLMDDEIRQNILLTPDTHSFKVVEATRD